MLNITSYPDSLCVSWQPPLENGGQDISSYQVYVRNDNATPTEDYMLHGNLGPSNLTYIVEPLMNSNRYRSVLSIMLYVWLLFLSLTHTHTVLVLQPLI